MTLSVKKGYKYRLYPTAEQASYLNQTLGACRKLWNVLLDQAIKEYDAYKVDNTLPKPKLNAFDFTSKIPALKATEELSWLSEYPGVALQQKASDLGGAFQNFFRLKKNYPKFKNRFGNNNFRLVQFGFSVEESQLKIAKLEQPLELRLHRPLPSKPSSVTISKTPSGKYFAIFTCEVTPKVTNGQDLIGIDLGLKTLIVTSDGEKIENPKTYNRYQKKLAAMQRSLSRKTKRSNNRHKARLKVAKVHEKIANIRRDWILKTCRTLVNRSKAIVIEDLNAAGMLKNHSLAKSIADASFGSIKRILTWMTAESHWCNLVIADRWFPSTQLCSCCGKVPEKKIRLEMRAWTCDHCGTPHDRDLNASKNLQQILERPQIASLLWEQPGSIILALRA